MNKVIVLVGENICDLQFQCGGRKEEGLYVPEYGPVRWVHHLGATSRHLPENSKHPRAYQKYLEWEIDYVLQHWNLLITTNSEVTLNIVYNLIRNGKLSYDQLVVHILSDDNKEIKITSTLDKEELYFQNWPYGFFDIVVS